MKMFSNMMQQVGAMDDEPEVDVPGRDAIDYVFQSSRFGDPEVDGYMTTDPDKTPPSDGLGGGEMGGMGTEGGEEDLSEDDMRSTFIDELIRLNDGSEEYQSGVMRKNDDIRMRGKKIRGEY